jgi:hypothetical protein
VGSTDGDELGLELGSFDGLLDGDELGLDDGTAMLPLRGSGSVMGWVFHSEQLKVCEMDRPTEGLMETWMASYLVLSMVSLTDRSRDLPSCLRSRRQRG